MKRRGTLFASLALVLLLAGCTSEDAITAAKIREAHKDAPKRFHNEVGGVEEVTRTINVPAASERLTVKAIYSAGGVAEFTFKNPLGHVEREDASAGGKQVLDDGWYVSENPTPGAWTFEIEIAGGAQYTFGFYY